MSANQAWDEVLASVEADVARTEELLAREAAAASGDPAARYLAPAQWQLPAPAPVLPALDVMPAVPVELRERIRELQERIVGLQAELAGELARARAAQHGPLARVGAVRPASLTAGPAAPALFFDSRV